MSAVHGRIPLHNYFIIWARARVAWLPGKGIPYQSQRQPSFPPRNDNISCDFLTFKHGSVEAEEEAATYASAATEVEANGSPTLVKAEAVEPVTAVGSTTIYCMVGIKSGMIFNCCLSCWGR